MVTVTCHTAGCPNADIPIEMVSTFEMDGETHTVDAYACGACSQPIEDVA